MQWFKITYKEDPNRARDAAYMVGFLYEVKHKDYKKATIWYKKSYDKGLKKALKKYNYFKNL